MVAASRVLPLPWAQLPSPGYGLGVSDGPRRTVTASRPGEGRPRPSASWGGATAAAGVGLGCVVVASARGRGRGKHRGVWLARACAPKSAEGTASTQRVSDAVVKIFVTRQRASMTVPWQALQVESSTGSGTFIRRRGGVEGGANIKEEPEEGMTSVDPPYWHFTDVNEAIPACEGDIVLTAAHVVADARDIRVQLSSRSGHSQDKYVARVIAIAHDCDLALLEVLDASCLANVEPMQLFKPPELLEVQARVQVIGFPVGGDYLSITEGILSRVEVVEYSHSRRPCLALTVDAAINAGNSGGPVVDPASGRLLAVAHQKVVATGVENQGHAVPPCLVWRFLYGQARGKPSPMPSLGAFMQSLESPAHRDQLGLSEGESGVLIREVNRGPGESEGELQAGDVLLQVGGYRVDNFSAVDLLGHRVALSAVQDLYFVNDHARLLVRRAGEDVELQAQLRPSTFLVPRSLYGDGLTMRLDYFVRGGLVFVPLTADFLEQAWPNQQDRPAHLMDLFYRAPVTPERSQAVVLLSILSDDVNTGHGSGYVGAPVADRVCGQPVQDMFDFAIKFNRAVEEEEFVAIDFTMASGPYTVVLKSAAIPEADARIGELYQVPAATSLPLAPELLE